MCPKQRAQSEFLNISKWKSNWIRLSKNCLKRSHGTFNRTNKFAFKVAFLLMPQVCRWLFSRRVEDMSGWLFSIPHLASVYPSARFDACPPVCPVRLFPLTLLITFQMAVWGVNTTAQIDGTIAALWLSKCFHPPRLWTSSHSAQLSNSISSQILERMLHRCPFTSVIEIH